MTSTGSVDSDRIDIIQSDRSVLISLAASWAKANRDWSTTMKWSNRLDWLLPRQYRRICLGLSISVSGREEIERQCWSNPLSSVRWRLVWIAPIKGGTKIREKPLFWVVILVSNSSPVFLSFSSEDVDECIIMLFLISIHNKHQHRRTKFYL